MADDQEFLQRHNAAEGVDDVPLQPQVTAGQPPSSATAAQPHMAAQMEPGTVAPPYVTVQMAPVTVAQPHVTVLMEPVETVSSHANPPPYLRKELYGGLGPSSRALTSALDEEAKDAKYLKLSEGRDVNPVTFAWRNVTLKVPVKAGGFMGLCQRKTGKDKYILDKVSGFIEPGQVVYIMGPSGAGKSSMLDALADRVKASVTGVQFLNGQLKVI